MLTFVGGQPLTGCHYCAGHLEPAYQPMIKKGKAFFYQSYTKSVT
jgi:hypothetical protein